MVRNFLKTEGREFDATSRKEIGRFRKQ